MNLLITKKLLFSVFALLFSLNVFAGNDHPTVKVHNSPRLAMLEVDSIYHKAKNGFDIYVEALYQKIGDTTLNFTSFKQAVKGYINMYKAHEIKIERYLTIIDFSKPSSKERLYIFDVCTQSLAFKTVVAHGVNSGSLYANKFSNQPDSHQSSIGFYVTTTTYKSHKYDLALRLEGKEYSNSKASSRGIVIHGANYASYDYIQKYGRLGRSFGCPALPFEHADKVINLIKEGSCLYIYYPNQIYQKRSKYLNRKDYLVDFIS
jgi:hypothetical protein